MVRIKDFRAIRPKEDLAKEVAALPYDVFSTEEAREEIKKHPKSFLKVDLPEATVSKDCEEDKGALALKNYQAMLEEGVFYKEEAAGLYIYELDDGKNCQRGLVSLVAVDDYLENAVKKHEKTRREKEEDRVRHIDALDAQTGLIFLAYRQDDEIKKLMEEAVKEKPFVFTTDDAITHRLWKIDDRALIDGIIDAFKEKDALYIADGHHRSASAVRVSEMRRKTFGVGDSKTSYNYFLSILYPSDELHVYDYNRVVKDLNGLSVETFLHRLTDCFEIQKETEATRPEKKGEFGMYLDGTWYRLVYTGEVSGDVIEDLDVSILQNHLLHPILGIEDPRSDKRIDFVGGVRGLKELERRVKEDMMVAFSLYPTALEELMAVADKGKVMPPKSTWFEPKPRSGLFIHDLETRA